MGGGLATLYFAVFAAANFYHLIEQLPAFALMGVDHGRSPAASPCGSTRCSSPCSASSAATARRSCSSTGVVNFPGLFGYMLVLGIGVLGICYWKNWPLVNYLSFFATYALFFAACRTYDAEPLLGSDAVPRRRSSCCSRR